jgi:hypothetical protein
MGDVPTRSTRRPAAAFRTGCWKARDIRAEQDPPLERTAPDQIAACHFAAPPAESIVAEAV